MDSKNFLIMSNLKNKKEKVKKKMIALEYLRNNYFKGNV